MELRPGSVAPMTSCKVVLGSKQQRMTLSYSAGKGRRMVFMLLGTETDEQPLDPVAALKEMGWHPEREPEEG